MLRFRLFLGMLILTLVLWGIGASALVMFNRSNDEVKTHLTHRTSDTRQNSGSGIASLLSKKFRYDNIVVLVLMVAGTLTAVLIYIQFVRYLVEPVVGLKNSIAEIRKGNFDFARAKPMGDSEFSTVISAFNDMAQELNVRRGEMTNELRQADMGNRALLKAIPSPVCVLGDGRKILMANPSAEQLISKLGLAGELPPKIARIVEDCQTRNVEFLPEDPREALLFRIDEEEFYYLPRIFRISTNEESKMSWALLLHNVSRIRWLDDMKTNLLSTVSHEIKTPLTGIRMVLHLLLEERTATLNEMQKTLLNSANGDCERLLSTLNTMLDLSRAESGTPHLARAPLELSSLLHDVVAHFQARAESKQIEFKISGEKPGLPDVLVDPVRLDEVLKNLVQNSLEHAPKNSTVLLKITKRESRYLRVSVIDQGAGVTSGSQERIFERFYRAPGHTSRGVGLGLFISREIMRAHEGRIGLIDRANNQTEFYIDVPIA